MIKKKKKKVVIKPLKVKVAKPVKVVKTKHKKVKAVVVKTKKVKTVVVKPVKVKALKQGKKPIVTCILTGQSFRITQLQLERQSVKFKFPSVADYAQYYVCKNAIKLLKEGYTDVQIRKQFNCNDRTDFPIKVQRCYAKKVKDRAKLKRREQRKALNDFINDPNPAKFILKPKGEPVFLDMKNADHVKSLTYFSCARPHVYLNNGRNCNGCNISKLCQCPLKRLK